MGGVPGSNPGWATKIKRMKTAEEIDMAIEKLHPINYHPHSVGYFVLENGIDMGNSDYCKNCIDGAVKESRKYHKERRAEILDKFKQIAETGFYKGVCIKDKYTDTQILKAKRFELKEYPSKVKFSYEGHDPDFGGGLKAPCSCENCGEYFLCNFEPNIEEAEHLLHLVNDSEQLTDMSKWEIEIGLSNYAYVDDEVKIILDKVAQSILNTIKKLP